MNIKTFIDRPVLSSVISIVIVLGGLIGLATLPIERYPNIAPPTIMVQASYTGASAETVQKSVIVPLEEALNGVENMTYMYSTATNNGSASIQIYFKQGTDPDMAAVNVQNCVSRATRQLPSEVTDVGVTVKKRQTNILEQIAVYSPNGTYDRTFIVNYIKINLVPAISRIPGVGDVEVRGSDYSMRIWLNPKVMQQYNLIPKDIANAISEQNFEAAAGTMGADLKDTENTYQYPMRYKGRLEDIDEFENIVIRAQDGQVLRLKDIAEIDLGTQSYQYNCEVNGCPGTEFVIYQTPDSNATEVINEIDKFLEKAREDFPPDLEMAVLESTNDFLYASIYNVVRTLLEAIILVTLVVFLFLRDLRSTVIPLIATIVSIIGTFFFLFLFDYSINLLTLFALVLSIGVVVDDAIIVVEAVHTKFDDGYKSPYKATVDAMGGITSAIVTCTLVFMAVFIPTSFMGGTSGVFYTQFGITMAVAVGISALNALTLSPALCAIMLKPKKEYGKDEKIPFKRRIGMAMDGSFEAIRKKYLRGVRFFLKHWWISIILLGAAVGLLYYYMTTTKTGLIPREDLGTININVQAKDGTTLDGTKKLLDSIDHDIIHSIDELRVYSKLAGSGASTGSSYGSFNIRLKHWDERPGEEHSVSNIQERIKKLANEKYSHVKITTSTPAMIPGFGAAGGFTLYLQDRQGGTLEDLDKYAKAMVEALKKRPEIGMVYTAFGIKIPQYEISVDAVACERAGTTPKEVISVLNGYYGGIMSTRINKYTKLYQVRIQADPKHRKDEQSLHSIYVRIGDNMAPISQFVKIKKINGPDRLARFNMFPAFSVQGRAAEGYSSGETLKAVEEVAKEVLPPGYGYEYAGIAREEQAESNNTVIIFAICILLIYLILAALYESYLIPLAVIISVPFGLFGTFLFAQMMDVENNIYLQTGLIMLIGLLSKTAILITEFASEKRAQGLTIKEAAYEAARERFRPILMTVLTMVIGMIPLMFASGVGANGNITIGSGVVGGMVVGTLAILFVLPAFFIIFQWLQEKISPIEQKNSDEAVEPTNNNEEKEVE